MKLFSLYCLCIYIILFDSLFQTCSVPQQTWWPLAHRAHPSHPPMRRRERVESPQLRDRPTFLQAEERSSVPGLFAVSYMSIKQLDGWSHLQLPGQAPPLPVLLSVLTGRLHGRDPLQLLPQTSAIPPQTLNTQQTEQASHSDPGDEVSSLVVVGAGRGSLHRRPHSVFVVLADEDARQLPQRRHVEGLKQLALIGSHQRWNPDANTPAHFWILSSHECGRLPGWLRRPRTAWHTPGCSLGTGRPERFQLPEEPGQITAQFQFRDFQRS